MKRRDTRLLLIALVLIAIPVAYLFWSTRDVERRRDATLAGVPDFPAPHQAPRQRPLVPGKPGVPPPRPAPPPQPVAPSEKHDPMASLVLGPGSGAGLVHVNALFNTPLFDRLRQCMPEQFRKLDEAGTQLGIDLAYDLDSIATVPGGIAMSGFFAGKPVGETLAGKGASSDSYRGATIYTQAGRCTAQLGNLVVMSDIGDCRGLLDRALAPTPANAGDELYGDVFLRSDLSGFRDPNMPAQIRPLVEALDSLTVRANVWDSVALSVEGTPREGRSPQDLAQIAQGAMSLIRSQLDEDQVELQTLAELAKVQSQGGKLELNLALPAQDLFDRLHFPCPGRDGGP